MKSYPFTLNDKPYTLAPVPADRFICCTPEEWKKVFADMLPKGAATPELLDALWAESKNPVSSFAGAFARVHNDVLARG